MGYHCVASGRVQGVGFRYHTYQLAKKYKLIGWVRNDHSGTVTFEIFGKERDIDAFFNDLFKGNGFIRIDHLEKQPVENTGAYGSFEIVY